MNMSSTMRLGTLGKYVTGLAWFLLLGSWTVCFSQITGSGDIRGTVTDNTGALIPGAAVTVLNVDTGVPISLTTDGAGVYDTSSIVLGNYRVTFSKPGFQQLVRGPVTVQAGYTTVNAQLAVGRANQQVVVNENVPLLTTESAEQSTTLQAQVMQQMPEVGQDWENFVVIAPGAVGAASASGTYSSSDNPQESGASVNGNLPFYNVTLDGASVILVNSGNNTVIPLEDVAELQMQTSTFSAQSGIGGIQYNQISKGGTSKFHGAAYEYFQNNALDAANYGFGSPVAIPFLRFDNFGGAIGGPILKKKLFFYFNYDRTYSNSGANTGYATLPTGSMTAGEMAGDFTGTNANGTPYPTIYDPADQVVQETGTVTQPDGYLQTCPCVTRVSFAQEYENGNRIPASRINPVAQAIEALYPTSASHPSSGSFVPGSPEANGETSNNYYYSLATATWTPKYFGRIDYDVSANNRITISDSEQDSPSLSPSIFASPIGYQGGDVENNNAEVSDVWTISPNLINEARYGFTDQLNFFADNTIGKNYPTTLGLTSPLAAYNSLPNFQIGGYNAISPAANAILKEFTFAPSDVVTLIKGKNILHFGGEFLAYQNTATAWNNIQAGNFNFGGGYTSEYVGSSSTGLGYADFLLGDSTQWTASVIPEYGARYKTPQMFVQDDIKLKPNLTLNVGVRYVIQHGWNEVKGNMSSFDPTVLNPATNTLGAMWFGTTHANGRTAMSQNIWNSVLPRIGFSWEPMHDTTVRAGYGLYDYNYSLGDKTATMGGVTESQGYAYDLTNGIVPAVNLSGVNTAEQPAQYTLSQLNYAPISTAADSENGGGPQYQEYKAPDTFIEQWTLAVQRMLTPNIVAEVAYVGSHGYDLPFHTDINQVPESQLGPSNNPSGRPYPQFQDMFSWDGSQNSVSNYNALQASITQRVTSGLSFSFNYTWSHFLDYEDSTAWQDGNQGTQDWQDAFNPSANYGPSNFNVRNAFKGYATYQLPFGIGRQYMNGAGPSGRVLDGVLGGWNVSGIVRAESGTPFTPTISNSAAEYEVDGEWYPNVIGNPKLSHPSVYTGWFNPAAFASPQAATFGNAHRNSVYGPDLTDLDMTLGKTFTLVEGIKWEIRGDASNVLNHPSFGDPNFSLYCPTLGAACASNSANPTIDRSLTNKGRTMQIGTRLSF